MNGAAEGQSVAAVAVVVATTRGTGRKIVETLAVVAAVDMLSMMIADSEQVQRQVLVDHDRREAP